MRVVNGTAATVYNGQTITYSTDGDFSERTAKTAVKRVFTGRTPIFMYLSVEDEAIFFSDKPLSLAILRKAFPDEGFCFNE